MTRQEEQSAIIANQLLGAVLARYKALTALITQQGGSGSDEEIEELDALTNAMNRYADRTTQLDKRFDEQIEELRRKKDRLSIKIRQKKKQKDEMKAIRLEILDATGGKLETDALKLSQSESLSADVYDENAAPDQYKKVKVIIDKAAVLRDLNKGKEVPGARLSTSKKLHVSIKEYKDLKNMRISDK